MRTIGLVLAAVLLVGCGGGGTPTVESPDEPTAAPVVLPRCDERERRYSPPPEEQPEPDPALTSANVNPDIPVEEGDEDPFPGQGGALLGEAAAWAQREAPEHYAGLWLDNEHGATVMAFTDEVDTYAAELRERFGAGWWVVEADHSEVELQEVQDRVIARMRDGHADGGTPPGTIVGTGQRTDVEAVTVEVVGGDDAALAELAADLDHPAICFEVLDPPPSYDPDGPVRTLATVPGWRDDLDLDLGADGALEIAYDRDTAERAFAENVPDDLPTAAGHVAEDGLHADLDTVDWDREALVVWSGGRSGTCPVWIDDVRATDGRVEVAEASRDQGGCTADFNAYRAVLAVDRGQLPAEDELPLPIGGRGAIEAVPYPGGAS